MEKLHRMPQPSLSIWCNAKFADGPLQRLTEGVRPHRLIFSSALSASNLVAGAADDALLEADVAFGQPAPGDVLRSPRLRWVHLTSAGYTRYDMPAIRTAAAERGFAITNSSHVYAEPVAQHALAFMLANARRLTEARDVQLGDHSWPALPIRSRSRLLNGQSVVLLGFGAISRRLTQLLAPFEVRITAFRRKPAGDEGVPVVGAAGLRAALATADHVVNVLPENEETRGFLTRKFFASFKSGAVFYNIGRGTTVDQEALLAALQSGQLGGAYLDVTDPEPLPPAHPLWTAPNCFITPHTAGGHDMEAEALVRHFLANLARHQRGEALCDRVV
jgi:phosphoglycerate dehydrogenase-like enzyme